MFRYLLTFIFRHLYSTTLLMYGLFWDRKQALWFCFRIYSFGRTFLRHLPCFFAALKPSRLHIFEGNLQLQGHPWPIQSKNTDIYVMILTFLYRNWQYFVKPNLHPHSARLAFQFISKLWKESANFISERIYVSNIGLILVMVLIHNYNLRWG